MVQDSLATAYDRYAAPIYRFLCGFLGSPDDAADAVQSVFVKLARRGPEGIKNLESYLWSAARNEARTLGRRKRGPYLIPRNGQVMDPANRAMAEDSLASLPSEQREVVILHVLEGLTLQEVAARLEISVNTVGSRFRYAKEKLKEQLS